MEIQDNPVHTLTCGDPSSDATEELSIDEKQTDRVEINRYASLG